MQEQEKQREKPIQVEREDFLSAAFDKMDELENKAAVEDITNRMAIAALEGYVSKAMREEKLGKRVTYWIDENTEEHYYEINTMKSPGFNTNPESLKS